MRFDWSPSNIQNSLGFLSCWHISVFSFLNLKTCESTQKILLCRPLSYVTRWRMLNHLNEKFTQSSLIISLCYKQLLLSFSFLNSKPSFALCCDFPSIKKRSFSFILIFSGMRARTTKILFHFLIPL